MNVSDAASLQLAVRLLQQDLEEIEHERKGKGRADEPEDIAIAIEAFKIEIARVKQSADDQEYAKSLSTAIPDTPASPPRTRTRNTPRTVAGPSRIPKTTPKLSVAAIDDLAGQAKNLCVSETETAKEDAATNSTEKIAACIACQNPQDKLSAGIATCGHTYCRSCLAGLFAATMADESLFPPRCCQKPISLDVAREWLNDELLVQFQAKAEEYSTTDRTYCSLRTCSQFIAPSQFAGTEASCPTCSTKTCIICKSAAHDEICPGDHAKKEILAMAKANGWQQCCNCQQIIELNTGCNHISKSSIFI